MAKLNERLIAGVCTAALFGLAACDSQQSETNTASSVSPMLAANQPMEPDVVLPKADPQRPITYPKYPEVSRRLGEEGQVVLVVSVAPSGEVTDAEVEQSSGHPRLDSAAVEEARESWRLQPGTVDGVPKPMPYKVAVTYKMED